MGLTKSFIEITHDTGYEDALLKHINNALAGKDMRADRIVTEQDILAARDERIRAEIAASFSKMEALREINKNTNNMVLVTVNNGQEDKQFWTRFDPDDRDCDGRKRSVKERIEDLEWDLDIEHGISEPKSGLKLDPGYSIKTIKRIKKVPDGVLEYLMY